MHNPFICFFTATILNWQNLLEHETHKQIILNSLQYLVNQKRIHLYGFVIMPNHIHLLWNMQEGHKKSDVQRDFLKFTSQQIKFNLKALHPDKLQNYTSSQTDRQFQFWERKSYTSHLYTRNVVEQKLDYIHANPLQEKWKLCAEPEGYYYSSARFYLTECDEFGFLTHYMEHM